MLNAFEFAAPVFEPESEAQDEDTAGEITRQKELTPEEILWATLSTAPLAGVLIGELASACRRTKRWVHYRLQELAQADKVVQVRRGHWRTMRPTVDGQPS